MTVEQIISNINALTPSDQLRVVNAVWGLLPDDVAAILPDQEAEIHNQRWQDYLQDPSSAITEDEFRKTLSESRKK